MKIKNRRNRNREDRRRGIYVLPNLVTTASLFCGFYAIIAAISGNFYYAALSILIAAVLDGLDGRIARLTRTTSAFGVQYDSLSDLIAFGLAPGILVFLWALKPFNRFGWMAAFLYVVCGALRLARFNVQAGQVSHNYFVGLPIPAAATIVATTILFIYQIGGTGSTGYLAVLITIYTLSFLMVSNIPYPSFKGMKLGDRKSVV
jgi:CDP-diacylglycerol--serine O-phosphatidyltransferase